jgi:hypothetical protein
VDIVNDMFRWLIRDDLSSTDIAGRLNGMGVKTDLGRRWTYSSVRQLLGNEKYIGNNLYNRQSFKLKKVHVTNPPDMWIRKEGAFDGIVAPEVFFTAQQILLARATKYTDEDLLDKLRNLFRDKGRLSGFIINEAPDLPNATIFGYRFGSLTKAYELVGFRPERDLEFLELNRHLRRLHPEIIERTQVTIADLGGEVWLDPKTDLLHLNQELVICLVLARCQILPSGQQRWRIRFDPANLDPDLTLAVRLAAGNQAELNYYLLPQVDMPNRELQVTYRNYSELECFRFNNLNFFYGMSLRERLQRKV